MRQALSQRALQAQPSPTLALTARAQELRRQGIDVLSFTAGEPDFDTPDFAKTGALEAIHAGYTKYTPTPGILPLREAIAESSNARTGCAIRLSKSWFLAAQSIRCSARLWRF